MCIGIKIVRKRAFCSFFLLWDIMCSCYSIRFNFNENKVKNSIWKISFSYFMKVWREVAFERDVTIFVTNWRRRSRTALGAAGLILKFQSLGNWRRFWSHQIGYRWVSRWQLSTFPCPSRYELRQIQRKTQRSSPAFHRYFKYVF